MSASKDARRVLRGACKVEPGRWFARAGSVVGAIGVIILLRPAFRGVELLPSVVIGETGLDHRDLKHWAQIGEPVPEYVWEDRRSQVALWRLGPAVTIVGGLMNGYGDLLNHLLT